MTAAVNRSERRKAKSIRRQKPRRAGARGGRVTVPLVKVLTTAVQQHQQGNLDIAEDAYRQVLSAYPDNVDALQFLGILLHQKGQTEDGIALLEKAVEIAPENAQAHVNLGAILQPFGRVDEAEARFRRALEIDPDNAEAHANLVGMFKATGQVGEAVESYEGALSAGSVSPDAHKRMADVWVAEHAYEKAIACLKRAVELAPDDATALNDLAFCCKELGNPIAAEDWYRKAVEAAPDNAPIRHNLATFLALQGKGEEARSHYEKVLKDDPDHWITVVAMGVSLAAQGRIEEGMDAFRKVLESNPDDAVIWNDVAAQYLLIGRHDEALEAFTKSVALDPERVEPQTNLGNAYMKVARIHDAVEAYEKALKIRPRHLEAHVALCRALKELNRYDEANLYARATFLLEDYQPRYFANPYQLLRVTCDFEGLHEFGDVWETCDQLNPTEVTGGLLYLLVEADDRQTNDRLLSYVRRWGTYVEKTASAAQLPVRPRTKSGSKIRLGFLSSDLRTHAVARFLIPLLTKYDRERFEVYCYTPMQVLGDGLQAQFQQAVDKFTFVPNMSDFEIARTIQDDEVDILFELNGFTQGTRLPVLACRPAPIQISWMGYPFSTGLNAVDYVLVDKYVRADRDDLLVEKQLEMPEANVCFGRFANVTIEEGLPLDRNGTITFGTLNNPYKFTPKTIGLWAEVLKAVPGSRFLLVRPECGSMITCRNFATEFAKHGIGPERLFFINNRTQKLSHLYYYNEIDISLDTFPLTGGTTTCEAAWMGVPVVTLYGESIHQRISYAVLNHAGFPELCADTPEGYVATAVALAGDRPRLDAYRRGMRQAMLGTTLCQEDRYLQQFQDLMEKVGREARARCAPVAAE